MKLNKRNPSTGNTSRVSLTMNYALGGAPSTTIMSRNPNHAEVGMTAANVQPRSRVEHYWAVRALKAEALLSARMAHHQELRSLASAEELKRSVSSFYLTVRSLMRDCTLTASSRRIDPTERRETGQGRKVRGKRLYPHSMIVSLNQRSWRYWHLYYFCSHSLYISSRIRATTIIRSHVVPRHHILLFLFFRPSPQWCVVLSFCVRRLISIFVAQTEHESSVVGTRLATIIFVILAALAYAIFRHRAARFTER